jgi:hypothetical protein
MLVCGVMARSQCLPTYGVLGIKRPEAYKCATKSGGDKFFVLGPYHVPTGGLDWVAPLGFDVIIDLLARYSSKGNVLAECFIFANKFGSVGEWMEARKAEVIIAFMDTPLEICLQAVAERRARVGHKPRDPLHVHEEYERAQKTEQLFRDKGFRVERLSRENGVSKVLGWLGERRS